MKTMTFYSKGYERVANLTHPYFPKEFIINSLKVSDGAIFGTPEFNLLSKDQDSSYTKVLKESKEGEIIFACDSDVLLNAPLEWFEKQLGDNDVIFQRDQNDACLGFWIGRVSPKLIEVFERIDNDTNAETNNQVAFNRFKDTCGLKIAYFDTKDVWNYGCLNRGVWNGEPFDFPDTLKAFHANYTIGIDNKVKLLEMAVKKYK
jgi:hypothetical protein